MVSFTEEKESEADGRIQVIPPVLTSATRHLNITAIFSESSLIGQKEIREKKTFSNNEIFMLLLTANKSPGT